MSVVPFSCGNRLLDALPASESADLDADLTIVGLKAHQATHSIGRAMTHVDFPIDAVLSVVATLKNGITVEVGTVGSESFVESEAALHSAVSSRTAFCQVQGRVGRMSLERFEDRMETSAVFARYMRHNVRAVLFSAQQFTVCNVKHSIFQRSARWFAMTADRVGRPEFTLTPEFLDAATALEQTGAIEYRRGVVKVLDRGVLERVACECYNACKASFATSLLR